MVESSQTALPEAWRVIKYQDRDYHYTRTLQSEPELVAEFSDGSSDPSEKSKIAVKFLPTGEDPKKFFLNE
jgi:hypothetical protein